jgi:hypothetical protein
MRAEQDIASHLPRGTAELAQLKFQLAQVFLPRCRSTHGSFRLSAGGRRIRTLGPSWGTLAFYRWSRLLGCRLGSERPIGSQCHRHRAHSPGRTALHAHRRSVDGHLQQCRLRGGFEGTAQRVVQRVAAVDGDCFDALAARQCAEIDIGKAGADRALQPEVPAEFQKRLIALSQR